MIKLKSKKTRMGIMLFLVPALVIYLVFQIIPIIGSIYFSLVDWNGIAGSAPKFVGLKNYIDAFHNADFILSLKNMARMVIISVICHTPIALLMAVAINTKCKGYRIFKALFFVPTVFPLTAVGLMWYFIFMPTGSFNSLLEVIGLSDLVMPWLVDPATAMNTIVFVNVWAGVGYYMVIILAGLTTIPDDVYEAAAIDGANAWQRFRYIILPSIKTIVTLNLILAVSGALSAFEMPYVITDGGFGTSTYFVLMNKIAHTNQKVGLASAMAVVLLALILLVTAVQKIVERRMDSDTPRRRKRRVQK